jgi:hypothetical protein
MVDAMKDNINTIKNTALVHFSGLMVENMLETGKMVNSMVEVNTIFQVDKKKSVNGFKVKKLNGLNKLQQVHLQIKNDTIF